MWLLQKRSHDLSGALMDPQMDEDAADEHAKTESDEGERKFDFRQMSQNH